MITFYINTVFKNLRTPVDEVSNTSQYCWKYFHIWHYFFSLFPWSLAFTNIWHNHFSCSWSRNWYDCTSVYDWLTKTVSV